MKVDASSKGNAATSTRARRQLAVNAIMTPAMTDAPDYERVVCESGWQFQKQCASTLPVQPQQGLVLLRPSLQPHLLQGAMKVGQQH